MMSGRSSLRLALVGQVEGGLSPWRSFRRWVRDVYHLKYTTVKLRFLVYLISRRNSTIILVGNPPSFWYHVSRPSVVVPNGDEETLLAVARRYGVDHLVLDQNRPAPLADFYARRGGAGWTLMVELDEGRVQVYRRTEAP